MDISFIETARAAGVIDDAKPVSEVLGNILDFLLSAFGILAILALAVSGLMYLLSAGDTERAAQAKRAVMYAGVGVAVALGALVIVRQIGSFL